MQIVVLLILVDPIDLIHGIVQPRQLVVQIPHLVLQVLVVLAYLHTSGFMPAELRSKDLYFPLNSSLFL